MLGGILGNNSAKKDRAMQKNAIQIRVADANKAGVNPLYALGAPTFNPTPSPLGSSLADAGQQLGRAVDATMNPSERASSVGKAAEQLQLQRMGLENEKLASEIRLMRQPGSPPAAPGGATPTIDGQGNARTTPPLDPEAKAITLRLPAGGGKTFDFPTSGTSNSQSIADQYGDTAQEIYGMWRLANDAYAKYIKPSDDYYTAKFWKALAAAQDSLPALPPRRRVGGSRYGRR